MLPLYALVSPSISKAFWNAGKLPTIFETPSMAHCPNSVLMVAVCWYLSCFEIASKTLYRVLAAPSSPFGPVDCISFAICTGSKPSLFHAPTFASVALLPRVMFVNTRFRLVPAFPSLTPIASMVAASAEVVCRSTPADTAGRIHHAGDFRRRGSHVAAQIVDGICNVDNLVVGLTKSGFPLCHIIGRRLCINVPRGS